MLNLENADGFVPEGFVSRRVERGMISIHPTSIYRHQLVQGGAQHTDIVIAIWSNPGGLLEGFAAPDAARSVALRELVRSTGPWDLAFALGRAFPEVMNERGGPRLRFEFAQEKVVRGGDGRCFLAPERQVHFYAVTDDGIVGLLFAAAGNAPADTVLARAEALWSALRDHT